ncbi:calcium-dependent channel, putative phosphate domain-containing protein [Hirsutella rhossiliensis]|uniref:Calcium-dependent channel, putative phosphate domain-containing protein n=1 Tax=Hirsutella rhossiliensis TaxID=111463 RepID=A0A9P8SLG7_9HYPO|nr:calcium-dependent channel, putative phosphate domain-containing protein [Hirsutella rhossiliensis]KAH0965795.1 calcium-dependent channel, putative phosphate domain-containing protein [Hirsutella rhossiliensis]
MAPDATLFDPFSPSGSAFSMATLIRRADDPSPAGKAQSSEGIGIVSFLTAIGVALAVFAAQFFLFILLRNKLARIFKPRTYLVPERERTEPPPSNILAMVRSLMKHDDRDVINKCGLDAYFFLRYLKTLLVIFIPICAVVLPILIPINYIGGKGQQVNINEVARNQNNSTPSGLDTLAWANVGPAHTGRYTAHLIMAILVIIWVCTVFFFELRVYIKVRQDYLTSAEHRLRASATTVLVSSIPKKWLSEDALVGLFDVFPGGVRNVWLNRDLAKLLDKISLRKKVHAMLESAETDLIKASKKAQLKRRNADERAQRKQQKLRAVTKEEKAARDAQEDAAASRLANSGDGVNAGSQEDVPHTVDDGVREWENDPMGRENHELETVDEEERRSSCGMMTHGLKRPLSKVGKGLRGAACKAGGEANGTTGPRHGFIDTNLANGQAASRDPPGPGRILSNSDKDRTSPLPPSLLEEARTHSRAASAISENSTAATHKNSHSIGIGTAGRQLGDANDMYVRERTKFWQFWKPPSGAYTSPIPQGDAARELMENESKNKTPFWHKVKTALPFMGDKGEDAPEYPVAFNSDHQSDEDGGAEWEKYLKKKDRPTHRLSPFEISWLPGLPLFNKKVDTIYWCRQELARLNVEIEDDQKHPERFPLMSSAFIQFNHQIAAHMACQSTVHHIPRHMYPRINEISPRDVIWDNMALGWWQEWLRSAIVTLLVCGMIFLWAVPVAWTAALSQLDNIIRNAEWLGDLRDDETVTNILKAVAGVLPALLLALLLILVPLILNFLAGIKGAKTGAQKTEFVQVYYFVFLFVQVFLIVSIASFFAKSIDEFVKHITQLQSVSAVLDLLAKNLPASANYFFSYMILQALSTSSGTLLQVGALFMWFIIAPMFDSTARNKWSRNTGLNQIQWGSFFPVYTNFACIALIYCVIAPLISVFAVITFSLLWLAQRYAMLYVNRFENDTGGVLYPRAINQTFTGIYFMELCMAGLFFIVQDTHGRHTCTPHGVIMIVVFILTLFYQVLLNKSFSPLFRYLPVTFEDEAVLRDEAFQRAQDIRFGLLREESLHGNGEKGSRLDDSGIRQDQQGRHLRDHVKQVGHWAKDGGKHVGHWAKDGGHQLRKLKVMGDNSRAVQYRRRQRQRDLESQRAIGDALYGGVHDDIEDLTPEERDILTRHAFQHGGLRARRPTVWIPRDDLGVSDDEIRRTNDYSEHIWISNEGTALDSKVRVVYGKNPPDFSEVDIINL